MKYSLFLLFIICANAVFIFQVELYGQYGFDPMGVFTRQTRPMLAWSSAAKGVGEFADSSFAQRMTSVDWSVPQEYVKEKLTDRQQNLDSLSLIPKQSMLMLDWADVANATRGFFASRLGRSLHSINWPLVLKKLEVPRRFRQQVKTKSGGIMKFIKSPLFHELFSGRLVLAILPVNPDEVIQQDEKQTELQQLLANNLLILLNFKQEHLVQSVLTILSLGSQKKALMHKGVLFFEFGRKKGGKFYLFTAGSQLVVSPAMEPVRQSIDLYLHNFFYEQSGFHQNNEYEKLKKHTNGRDDFFLYADVAAIRSLVNKMAFNTETEPPAKENQGGIKHKTAVKVRRMVLFHHTTDNLQQFTSVFHHDLSQSVTDKETVFARQPVLSRGLSKMPSNLLVYFWTNWFDLKTWWRTSQIWGSDVEGGMADDIAAWLEKQTGMSMNGFLSLFSQEFGFNVDSISNSGFIPVPRICICFGMKDREQVKRILEKMIIGLPVRRTEVAGMEIVSFILADGLMQPSYAILDKFLVIADGRDQIENLLRGNPERLVDDADFLEVDTGMAQPSNMLLFVRVEKLNEELKEIISWAPTLIGIRDQKAAARSDVLVKRVLLPLLDGLKMYRAEGIRSYSTPGEVIFDVMLSTRPDEESESKSLAIDPGVP